MIRDGRNRRLVHDTPLDSVCCPEADSTHGVPRMTRAVSSASLHALAEPYAVRSHFGA
jgi:hypothetical protein